MDLNLTEEKQVQGLLSNKGQSPHSRWKNCLFAAMSYLQNSGADSAGRGACLEVAYETLQLLSLIGNSGRQFAENHFFQLFWYCLALTRLDFLAAQLGLFEFFVYAVGTVLGLQLALFL